MNNDATLLTQTDGELMQAIRATYGDDYADEIIANIAAEKASIDRANGNK